MQEDCYNCTSVCLNQFISAIFFSLKMQVLQSYQKCWQEIDSHLHAWVRTKINFKLPLLLLFFSLITAEQQTIALALGSFWGFLGFSFLFCTMWNSPLFRKNLWKKETTFKAAVWENVRRAEIHAKIGTILETGKTLLGKEIPHL